MAEKGGPPTAPPTQHVPQQGFPEAPPSYEASVGASGMKNGKIFYKCAILNFVNFQVVLLLLHMSTKGSHNRLHLNNKEDKLSSFSI